MRKGMALAWAAAGLLWLLSAGSADAQVAVTKCVKSMDSPTAYCNSEINSDLALPPGDYQVQVRVFDRNGNPSTQVLVDGTANVIGVDTTPPIITKSRLTRVGHNVFRVDVECTDNEHCSDAEITVTPKP